MLAAFDAYHAEPPFRQNSGGFRPEDLVAYFCAEFGVHESLPIYSGGLGILAGDHCKAASDFKLPFVAIGLLYRQGYFVQTIDGEGRQRAEYHDSDFDDLPIAPVRGADGGELAPLYVGKIAQKHIPIMEELRHRSVLREPPLTPRLLESPDARERLEAVRRGINLTDLICPETE